MSLLRTAIALFLLFCAVSGSNLAAAEKVEELSPQGYVNDFAGAVDSEARQRLMALSEELDQKANAQLAIVTIHTLEGDTAQDFANRLFEKWVVGPKGKDRGVMVLVAIDDRQYWTEVGYGLEPILPDGKVGGFGREMLPLLRQRQYGAALLQISSQIASTIAEDRGVALSQGEPVAPPPNPPAPSFFGIPPPLLNIFVLLLIFGGWRLLPFLFALLIGSRYPRRRGYRGWWMGPMGGWGGGWTGGGWGGGFGGSGGGGGFGGFGGGASGGGGAGGGW